MKIIKNVRLGVAAAIVMLLGITAVSCTDSDEKVIGEVASPEIENVLVADTLDIVPVTIGYANNMYIIRGKAFATTQKVYFNDVESYFNPALGTDTSIFVTIDVNTPYENAPNKLRVVTKYGVAEYDFVVAPPAPSVHSFNPINTADGGEITIYGSFFLDPVVTVGGTPAEIVSSSLTEIHAILPVGSQLKKVEVTTISGSSEYGTAVGTAIYDDVFYSPWDIESWNNHEYVNNHALAAQGNVYIKKSIDGWGNIQGNWGWNDQLSGYTGIHFFVRSDDEGKLVWIFNGNGWGDSTHVINTTPQWQEVRLSWADLGNPAAIQNLSFQEFTGSTHVYYLDNIGYTVD
ncbi:IPT/TIG domain-containing protein [Flavobacterium silvaticum]|uniref:IPT/TIG domain-containing protein n=1 Tax=Flavobacterium silvaticum TaxID=1852020 RepID=A0A972FQ94_9FLAO|nr:IPT/TIG domain-containing protein [Flavobacterium silvaticum]NMH27409.1 hypothetical protein [Flavobacterium silvaticum]